jgi:hypothetical protein
VRALRLPAALGIVVGLCVLTAWMLAWPIEKAVYLAPVIVCGFAAVAALVLVWGKVALQSLRETRRPRLVLALWIGGIALLALLSFLGVELPRGE